MRDSPREIETAYEAETRELIRRRAIVASYLALVLVPLFGVPDYFMYPEQVTALIALRLLSLVVTGAILFLLRGPIGETHPSWLGIGLGLEVGLAISGIPVYFVGSYTPHYVSLALLILSLALLLPVSSWQAGSLSIVLAATYVAASIAHGDLHDVPAFVTQVSAILSVGVIALVSMIVNENMRRKEHLNRTALLLAAEEKSRLIDDLQEKKVKLEGLNQDMEDLLYVASHDLRAPLINVQGFTREVQLGLTDLREDLGTSPEAKVIFEDIEESLRFILSAISRMDGLIGALLNVSRIGTRTNPTEEVQLQAMVEKIVESFRYQLDQKQIQVNIGELPVVLGDSVRLNQVFSNLIDNAIKYMGDGPRRDIAVGLRNGNGTGTFYVSDTGPGIPRESQETVFRLFRRLANGIPGEGLGLTMVRKIVEKHGGRIWIESAPGEGSTFCFTLRNLSSSDQAEEERHVC